jgi:hypothetical protein
LGGAIRPAPEKKAGKEVTISFAKAVAQENKRGSVTSAQKAGRVSKASKQSKKRKRTAENEAIGEDAGPVEPVQAAKRQRRGQVVASVPQPSPRRFRRRG